MRKVTQEEFERAAQLHKKWLHGEPDGEQMNFEECDLSGVDFLKCGEVDLSRANLSKADLRWVKLAYTDLSWAILGDANLSKASLPYANLHNAILQGATLYKTNLMGANLSGARLFMACLNGADLCGANLSFADLTCAYMRNAKTAGYNVFSATMEGAILKDDVTLVGDRPVCMFGPIGSRRDHLIMYCTNKGLRLQVGCFYGTLDEFIERLKTTHGDNKHAQEYTAALTMATLHAQLWAEEQKKCVK